MTDFRHVYSLHAYSGGTVPDSNRIHYSPLNPNELSGTQASIQLVLILLEKKLLSRGRFMTGMGIAHIDFILKAVYN